MKTGQQIRLSAIVLGTSFLLGLVPSVGHAQDSSTPPPAPFKFVRKKKTEQPAESVQEAPPPKKVQEVVAPPPPQAPKKVARKAGVESYPDIKVGVSYMPGYLNLNQTVTGNPSQNISGVISSGYGGDIQAQWTQSIFTELAVSYFTVQQAYILPIQLGGTYCFDFGGNKVCPGILIGMDSFPILLISSASNTLNVYALTDFDYGAQVKAEFPITNSLAVRASAGFQLGLDRGGSSAVTVQTEMKYWGLAELDIGIASGWSVAPGFIFEDRSTSFTTSGVASKATDMNYLGRLSLRYDFKL